MAAADSGISGRKTLFFAKLLKLMDEYPKILVVNADNIGSNHLQRIRKALLGKAVMLMGKNTMVRKAIRGHSQKGQGLDVLLPHVKGNVGFIFSKGDLNEVKKVIDEYKVQAPAKAGTLAPSDVVVPAQQTALEPTKTSFFQALNINTKITRGTVEIVADVPLLRENQKIGNSEAALLQMLDIKPFKYGLKVQTVYDNGQIYAASLLDVTQEELLGKFRQSVQNVAAVSLAVGFPTRAAVPHVLIRGFKNVLALALGSDHSIPAIEKLKTAAASAPAAAPADKGKGADKKAEPKKEEKKKEEPKEEEDADMGLGLFD